ncbi:MAG: hypothetical protein IT327_15665 [Anaerolineae bacterium]|nr:hypothetical protein [Anaerolineae bacterium]
MKQMVIFLTTGLFCLLLLGCGGEVTAVSTPTSLAQLPTETASHTPSPTPTETATPEPTASQTRHATPTKVPTYTPRPTNTSTPTATPTPDHFAFPAWVTDPSVNVLLLGNFERIDKFVVTLLNAQTSEHFDFIVNDSVRPSWVWHDNELYLQIYHPWSTARANRDAFQELINLTTGEISTPPLSPLPGALAESPDGHFLAQIVSENKPPIAAIIETETGNSIELHDPFNGRYGSYARAIWSQNSEYLALQRVQFYEDMLADYGLTIYTSGGDIFRQYDGLYFLQWSPVSSSQLLYWDSKNDSFLPCVLNIFDNSSTCYETIIMWASAQDVKVAGYVWSPDGTKISFVHWNDQSKNNGLCFVELSSEQIRCLVQPTDLTLDYQAFPINHFWSPDGEQVALFINPQGLSSDDGAFTSVLIVDKDGRDFYIFDEVLIPSLTTEIWRPPINP